MMTCLNFLFLQGVISTVPSMVPYLGIKCNVHCSLNTRMNKRGENKFWSTFYIPLIFNIGNIYTLINLLKLKIVNGSIDLK